MKLRAVLPLILVIPTMLAGQDEPLAPVRQGFWLSVGLGAGSAGVDCTSCSSARTADGTGYLALGGTVSPKVLLGGEASAWVHSESGVDEVLAFATFVVQWYPSTASGFFLKFGVGGASYEATDNVDALTATAGAGLFGFGVDIQVGDKISLAPFLTSLATSSAEFKINGVPFPTSQSITLNVVQLGLAITFH